MGISIMDNKSPLEKDLERFEREIETGNTPYEIKIEDVASRYSFYSALSRIASMPHLVNSRILSGEIVRITGIDIDFLSRPILRTELAEIDEQLELLETSLRSEQPEKRNADNGYYIVKRKVLSKNMVTFWGIEVWDFKNDAVILYQPTVVLNTIGQPINCVNVYANFYQNGTNPYAVIQIQVRANSDSEQETLDFYCEKVVPKIERWMVEETGLSGDLNYRLPKCSMMLIDKSQYWICYKTLKQYYNTLKNVWTTLEEPTDPQKMIYEEMAIASYLFALWKVSPSEESKISNFVDIGCGNGLLSLFLTLNEYSGRGVDMRKRKLWNAIDAFAFSVNKRHLSLSERTLLPGTTEFSNEAPKTWLLGNHSDELTPWIPIWARENNSNFFIIPCCAHDFSCKFQRKKGDKNSSIYTSYIFHLKGIIESCGYKCLVDRLQIPSTKRICLIGLIDHPNGKNSEEVSQYIHSVYEDYADSFKARESQQRVQNCTRLTLNDGTDVVNDMAKCILDKLVSEENYILLPGYNVPWNKGMEKLSLEDAANLISDKHKDLIKRQGNGIKTLLKNNRQVFNVIGGNVSLRSPCTTDIARIKQSSLSRINSKRCFLQLNHPNGCPLSDSECPYKHDDLTLSVNI